MREQIEKAIETKMEALACCRNAAEAAKLREAICQLGRELASLPSWK